MKKEEKERKGEGIGKGNQENKRVTFFFSGRKEERNKKMEGKSEIKKTKGKVFSRSQEGRKTTKERKE